MVVFLDDCCWFADWKQECCRYHMCSYLLVVVRIHGYWLLCVSMATISASAASALQWCKIETIYRSFKISCFFLLVRFDIHFHDTIMQCVTSFTVPTDFPRPFCFKCASDSIQGDNMMSEKVFLHDNYVDLCRSYKCV